MANVPSVIGYNTAMPSITKGNQTALIILNPVAGLVNAQVLTRLIEARFHAAGWTTRIHLTQPDEDFSTLIIHETEKGVDVVVAAGGDGTIAAVAGAMAHSTLPLGMIPIGTWNAIGRHFRVSLNPLSAISTITGKHKIRRMDLMEIGGTIHAMNLGVGFSSRMIAGTARSDKRRLGKLAYFGQMIRQAFGLEMKKYIIEADGKIYRGRAAEIFVANYGIVGLNLIESALNIHPDDGKVDVLIFKTRTILDFPSVLWNAIIRRKKRVPKYQQLSAVSKVAIKTTPALPVQADGELLGDTPISITVLPRAVKVIVPSNYPG
jgi:YegS/Rv2252/BmrU family lipid kinase